MVNIIREKIGIKVAILVNLILFFIIAAGTYVLIWQQSKSLEKEFLSKGRMHSATGAKIIGNIFDEAIDNGVFSVGQAFDKEYVEIPGFNPPKFHTKYDSYLGKAILPIEDEFLLDESIVFAVAVDTNGYLPTHNTRYQQPITGDPKVDLVGNRTKRIFNDPVGINSAKNTQIGYLQIYKRDTGVTMWDISSPIYVKGRHWGGFRIGMSLNSVNEAKQRLLFILIGIMGCILLISFVCIHKVVTKMLRPLEDLTMIAIKIADGSLNSEIDVSSKNEIGRMEDAVKRLQTSLNLAMRKLSRKQKE